MYCCLAGCNCSLRTTVKHRILFHISAITLTTHNCNSSISSVSVETDQYDPPPHTRVVWFYNTISPPSHLQRILRNSTPPPPHTHKLVNYDYYSIHYILLLCSACSEVSWPENRGGSPKYKTQDGCKWQWHKPQNSSLSFQTY